MSEPDPYGDAIREAYAVCPANVPVIETLEISHESIAAPIYICGNTESITATLETLETVTFEASAIKFTLPAKTDEGIQELALDVCNADRRITDFFEQANNFTTPVTIKYRPYLANDLSAPQMNPPLLLTVSEASAQGGQVSAKASFADLVNKPFPAAKYVRSMFPNLAGF